MSLSFGEARSYYANQAAIKSAHTHEAYLRAIDLFLAYLADRKFNKLLPIQAYTLPTANDCLVEKLTSQDEPILQCFAEWLQTPGDGSDKRPYASSTVELRLAGVQRWFEFMKVKDWLPDGFSLKNAISLSKNRNVVKKTATETKAVEAKPDLSHLVAYYDRQLPPKQFKPESERYRRWELTRLRNAALLRTLAETGGQISAILDLNTDAFADADSAVQLQMAGKGGYTYQILLKESLPAIRAYLRQRQVAKTENIPLFVSHDAGYDGSRMSRIIAWRIVQRAAKAVGLPSVSPHDLRHWRAQQLIEAGHSMDDLQVLLGHRSIHTVRTYYGHLFENASPDKHK